jgi:hypothetical protein
MEPITHAQLDIESQLKQSGIWNVQVGVRIVVLGQLRHHLNYQWQVLGMDLTQVVNIGVAQLVGLKFETSLLTVPMLT